MKKVILVSIAIILMIGCESITGPENSVDPIDPIDPIEEIKTAEVEIVSWSQIYNKESEMYENVTVIFTIENTGNVPFEFWKLDWTFVYGEVGKLPKCFDKQTTCNESLAVDEVKTDTIYSGFVEYETPVRDVICTILNLF